MKKNPLKWNKESQYKEVIIDALSLCPKKSDRKAIRKSEVLSSVIEKSDERFMSLRQNDIELRKEDIELSKEDNMIRRQQINVGNWIYWRLYITNHINRIELNYIYYSFLNCNNLQDVVEKSWIHCLSRSIQTGLKFVSKAPIIVTYELQFLWKSRKAQYLTISPNPHSTPNSNSWHGYIQISFFMS